MYRRYSDVTLDGVVRYVPTYINRDGMRTLVRNMQGRDTFATEALAQDWLDGFLSGNSKERLIEVFGPQSTDTFEVRSVECWPGHFDPKTCWFD